MKKVRRLFTRPGKTGASKNEPSRLETSWRNLEKGGNWTRDYQDKILEDILMHEMKDAGTKNIRILLLGQIKAGKSSFVNTVATIDKGRIAQITRAGGSDSSLTFALKEFIPTGVLKNICILDTMGVEEIVGGLNLKDIVYLVNGNIHPNYKFNLVTPIDRECPEFRSEPRECDKVNCIVFVVDANILGQDNISDATRRKVKDLQNELKLHDVATLVLLTKIDILCELVEQDIENTFLSEKVKATVDFAAELYNVPKHNVFPIKNYEGESERNIKLEILILLALRQMLRFGTDFLNTASASDQF